ncbi:putative glycosyltransferase [Leptolyngbya sp. PCC 7375]|nr:putative glycosyltransferase [Leptolyngbya sp. PCC 7375]
MTAKTTSLDISEHVYPILGVEKYDALWVLVRHRTRPLGWVWISCEDRDFIPSEELQWCISQQLELQGTQNLLNSQLNTSPDSQNAAPESLQPISIIICTRDRTEFLKICIRQIIRLDYPHFEVIVVDNAPSNDETFQLIQQFSNVRYVQESRPGLDWARNRGIKEARYDVIAFTDDDACVDALWLHAINNAFQEPEVMAVTGLVGPAELEADAQYVFEFDYGGMGHGLKPKFFRRQQMDNQDLLWASGFGVGVNMAYRRQVFSQIGDFDIALDVGTPSGGCGDVEMFHRLVANGYTLMYEPSMLVWHTHRRDMKALQKQIFDNGRSFGAYLLTCIRNRSVPITEVVTFLLYSWFYQWILMRLLNPGKFPRKLVWVELFGMLKSPIGYMAAQKKARHITELSNTIVTSAQAEADKSENGSLQEVI